MTTAAHLGIVLQPRDIEILRGLFESRIATLSHLASLYFNGRSEATKKRIQKLKANGVIRERPRRGNQAAALYLTKDGFDILNRNGHLADFPPVSWAPMKKRLQVSDLNMQHELQVMDFKSAMISGMRKMPTLTAIEFSTWPRLFEFAAIHPKTGRRITIKPDGFIRIADDRTAEVNEQRLFLELDRSTERQETLVNRIHGYLDYQKRGGLADRLGHHKENGYPFRVLIVCQTRERRNNTALRLLNGKPSIREFAWLTTVDEANSNPFGEIWMTPAALMRANESQVAEVQVKHRINERSARAILEQMIEKRSLFTERQ